MTTEFDLAMASLKGASDYYKADFQGQSDFLKNQLQTQFDQVKRDADDHQAQIAFQRASTGNGTDWGLYQSNLERAGLINKNALPKGFKNQYYDDAIASPDKYTWGVWDTSKDRTTDNWQPKPRVAGDARDTVKKTGVSTTTVTSQPIKSALVQTTPPAKNPSTIESSSAKFAQTVSSTPTIQQLENNQPSYSDNTSSLPDVDSLANQNNKPKNYFDTGYFSK